MNLSPIGTAYQASRNQSFNGIGGAAQSGMDGFMQMFGQVAEKRKAGVDNEVKKSLANLMAALQHRKALEPPKPTPVMGKGDLAPLGLGLLLALLTKQKGSDIAQFGEGFMGARGQMAGRQDQFNQQAWQSQNQDAQAEQQMAIERAKVGYGAATDEQSRFDGLMKEERGRRDALTAKGESAEQALWNRYLQANSPDEKEFIGGELVRRGKMNPEFVSNAVADMRTKEQGAKRDRVLGKLLQYVTDPAERQKLAQWAANMTPGDLDVAVGLSDAELLTRARRTTEDAMRPGKVAGQDLANDLKRIQKEWMPKMNSKKLQLTDAQIANYKSLTETRPEFLRLALAKFDLGIWTAENNAGNTRFDNEIKAYKERVAPILAGHAARGKALEKARADAEEALASSGGSEEARSSLLAITQEQQKVKNEVERLTEGVPTPKSMSYTPSGKGGGMASKVSQAKVDMESRGYKVEQYGPGSIPSSKHKTGEALDLYPGKSGKTLAQVFEDAKNNSDFNYLIFNGKQYKRTATGWAESAYSGPDPHTGHVHADYGNGAPAKTTKKTQPVKAKAKVTSRGKWKVEVER